MSKKVNLQVLFAMIMVTLLNISFLSCSSDDDEKQNNGSSNTTDVAVTGNVSNLGITYAHINGYVNLNLITSSYTNQQIGVELSMNEEFDYPKQAITKGLEGNKITVVVDTLSAKTKYYYRTFVRINDLNYYGEKRSFTTKDFSSITSTGEVSDITYTSAKIKCYGDASSVDMEEKIHIGIVYSITKTTLHPDSANIRGFNVLECSLDSLRKNKSFEMVISQLMAGTTYYYCSFTRAGVKYKLGEIKSFTTDMVVNNANPIDKEPALQRLEFPHVKGGNSLVLIHSTNESYGINYSVEWDCDKKAQRWSAYQITAATIVKNTSRYYSTDNQYPFDPLLPNNTYLTQDCFWNSGYDHGQMCPSSDRLYSDEANYQTFFLTNMQPQSKAFHTSENSPWYRLVSQIRNWAKNAGTEVLYVVKGGTIEDNQVLKNQDGSIKLIKGEMRVPQYFFVALLLKNGQGYKAVGFWMEHRDSYINYEPLSKWAVNIRELEGKTGIDFFCNLSDDVENRVETQPLENVKQAWGL